MPALEATDVCPLGQTRMHAIGIDTRMTKSRHTPAVYPLLNKHDGGLERKHNWNYRTLTGILGHLQFTTRPDI